MVMARSLVLSLLVLFPQVVWAQPEADILRLYLGATGTQCVVHPPATGAPSTSLGAVCDLYVRKDAPYTVYVKTGASTWAPLFAANGLTTGDLIYASGANAVTSLPAVSSGRVLSSAGSGTAPAYTATPSVTTMTATGNPGILVDNANANFRLSENDAAADNRNWVIRAQTEQFAIRAIDDALAVGTTWLTADRTGTAVDNVTISPSAGDIIFAPGGQDILPDTGYTKNLGSLTTKYLTLHAAELWVETLVAQNTIATIGGRILVGPTTTLTADLLAAATTMSVKHNQMVSGARVVLQANGSLEWIAVTSGPSGTGPYTYSITRDLDGTGANNWYAGDAVFNTGTTGNGFIDLYSVAGVIPGSTAGPTIVGNVRTGTTYSQVAPRWSIGNLNGICGYATEIYGATFGDCSATNVTIDATNGFRIRSATTDKFKADTSGNLSITGDLSVGTAGIIRSGAASYASGTGYVLDYNSGTPRMRIGTTGSDRLQWDGSNLTLVSSNLVIDSTGISLAPNASFSSTRAYRFTVPTGELGVYGSEGGGTRYANLWSRWTGVGDSEVIAAVAASHQPSSGGTSTSAAVTAVANGTGTALQLVSSLGDIQLVASTMVDLGDLWIYQNNGSSTARPYIRSDGNYLVIDSRSTANGGSINLGYDTNTDITLGAGGGTTTIYKPFFNNVAPHWVVGLAQTTVGAAGGGSALPATPTGYVKIIVNGVAQVIPVYNP